MGACSAAPAATGILAAVGPIGWITLGAGTTFDCWKPVLRDTSSEPSAGMLIKNVLADDRVKWFQVLSAESASFHIRAQNIYGETFDICPVVVGQKMYAHATMI